MSFIDELVAAAGRHGVPCVVLGGGLNGNGNGKVHEHEDDEDDESVSPTPFMAAPGTADPEEVQKLRAQVQKLSSDLQAAQAARPAAVSVTTNGGAAVPAGDHGSADDLSVETLGFSDEALTRKVMRAGYETIGKLRAAFMDGTLAGEAMKLKKDWLIEVGMKLAGALPSGGGGHAPAAAGPVGEGDCPTGHKDRPWQERLAAAKQKQAELDESRAKLAAKQAEVEKLVKKNKEVPPALDDELIRLEESIIRDEARTVVLRWALNIDHDSTITLDEALKRANLGPWMSTPQPRLAPT